MEPICFIERPRFEGVGPQHQDPLPNESDSFDDDALFSAFFNKMLAHIARKASTVAAVEMSKSIPPNVVLPLPTKSGMFTLSPEKTVSQLAAEIQNVDRKAKNITFTNLEGSAVDANTTLDKLSNHSFWINVNKNKIRIFPSVV